RLGRWGGGAEGAAGRRDFRYDVAVALDSRKLPRRVDGQIRLLLHRRSIVEDLRIVGLTHLFEHPPGSLAPRHRVRVEDEVGHGSTPAWNKRRTTPVRSPAQASPAWPSTIARE